MLDENVVIAGRYRIVRLLGRGGMGAVYEAIHVPLSRRVALKTLLPEIADDPDLLARFRREAETTAGLRHPNIVAVTDFFAEEGYPPFIVMELLEGRTLGNIMDTEGRLDPPRAAFIGMQILAALAAAHRVGVIHRDIKPGNLFVERTAAVRDFVKVLDFGVAKLLADAGRTVLRAATQAGQVLGTLAYMPPEQAGGGVVDNRADLYAVGATLYHAISGLRPQEAALRVGGARPSLAVVAPWVPPTIGAAIDRAMRADPMARFSSAEEMAAALAPPSIYEAQARAPSGPILDRSSSPTLGPGMTAEPPFDGRDMRNSAPPTTGRPALVLQGMPMPRASAPPRMMMSVPPPAPAARMGWSFERKLLIVAIVVAVLGGIASVGLFVRSMWAGLGAGVGPSMTPDDIDSTIYKNMTANPQLPRCPSPLRCTERVKDHGVEFGMCEKKSAVPVQLGTYVLVRDGNRVRPAAVTEAVGQTSWKMAVIKQNAKSQGTVVEESNILGRMCAAAAE